MSKEITNLKSPIDVMHLIHKAFSAEGNRVVGMVDNLSKADDLKAVKGAFTFWASALGYHATNEDKFMTGPITNSMVARENEEEHARLAKRLDNVASCLSEEFSNGDFTTRGHRHLYGCVVALQIAQGDHFEEEVEFVLPLVRERMSEDQQLEVVRRLLWDGTAKDKRWVAAWVSKSLTPRENILLMNVEERLTKESVKGIYIE